MCHQWVHSCLIFKNCLFCWLNQERSGEFDSPWDRQKIMYKVAIIEEIHKDGLDLLKRHSNFDYELIEDVSEKNLIEKLPAFDACTLRVSKLDETILKHCQKLNSLAQK